jgi:solute carrier family 26 (sodium-independent sulfate anion transporter), member 11
MCDLVLPLPETLEYWNVSPLECLIFVASDIITIFTSIEVGLYLSIDASLALLLCRLARPKDAFLARVQIQSPDGEDPVSVFPSYVPISYGRLYPTVIVEEPAAGVLIYRFGEEFTYPNASLVHDRIIAFATDKTCPDPKAPNQSLGDRKATHIVQ